MKKEILDFYAKDYALIYTTFKNTRRYEVGYLAKNNYKENEFLLLPLESSKSITNFKASHIDEFILAHNNFKINNYIWGQGSKK